MRMYSFVLGAFMLVLQHLLCQHSLEDAFSLLFQHLSQLCSSSPSLAQPCNKAWLALVVAAAEAGQEDLRVQVVDVLRQAAQSHLEQLDMAGVSGSSSMAGQVTGVWRAPGCWCLVELAALVEPLHTCVPSSALAP